MIAQELEENIQFAFKDARERELECVTVEHLLMVLLDTKEVTRMMRQVDSDRRKLRSLLEEFLQKRVPRRQTGRSEPRQTPGFSRVIRKAIAQAKENDRTTVTSVDVLIAIFTEPESFAAHFMDKCGLTKNKLSAWTRRSRDQRRRERKSNSELFSKDEEDLTLNLTRAALDGRLDMPHPRAEIIAGTLRVLCRKYKSNPVLVGDPGVGKTAIVHSIAHLAANEPERLPASLRNLQIHEVNVASLVAGTKYRGDFEARLKKLVAALSAEPRSLLFIDEIHTLIGAGSVSGGSLDAANIFKPALSNGTLSCIGATTQSEYARVFEQDAALSRRFQKIEVPEPEHAEAVSILREFKPRLEKHHAVQYAEGALADAVRLADRFISSRSLPDKAIDLLDETAAAAALAGGPFHITDKELGQTVARISGMPPAAIERDERKVLRALENTLGQRVFGQTEAVNELSHAVRRARLGITQLNKPIGSFLFAGPTGVGKTEMAKALADSLGVQLVRFDMSEHMERHSVSLLIGAPPGYVGYDSGGQLTDQINRHPHCVLLLDEIEKAHPDIFNILLQVMDHGQLTDNTGNRADFRHVVIIMTTNAGADSWEKVPLGFGLEEAEGDELAAVQRLFAPEFRNRLDKIICFAPLDKTVSNRVVARELRELTARLKAERGYQLKISAAAKRWLRDHGFSRTFGARPLQRLINSTVIDAIVNEDAQTEIATGELLKVDCDTDGNFTVTRQSIN